MNPITIHKALSEKGINCEVRSDVLGFFVHSFSLVVDKKISSDLVLDALKDLKSISSICYQEGSYLCHFNTSLS